MAFSESWLSELLAKNEIVSVISTYMELKPKGRRLWGRCPLHGEKTPSFSVSPDKQLFYCFGCHAGGSVIQFIMDMERLSFPEAVKFLAERAGMQMPEEVDDRRMQQERVYRDRLAEANKLAARFYMEALLGAGGGPGRAYLRQRGVTSESVKRFGIGYAPEGWSALKDYLFDKGFTQKELLDAGLLVHNETKGSVYDAYRGRLTFPIVGLNGRVLGFGARVLNNDKPKYINTGDTPLYNKRANLYALNLQKGARTADLLIVEGYMDVIGLYEAGVTNVVASLGTALTQQQAHLIKRYADTVYIAYDGDAAGQNAMIRGLEILAGEGLNVRVIVFPNERDPDEFVRESGADAFGKLKDEALTLNAYKIESMARGFDLDNQNDRERYAIAACRVIASLQPVERDRYYQQLARKTGYPLEALKEQGAVGGVAEKPALHRTAGARETKKTVEDTERSRAEAALLNAMLSGGAAAEAAVQAGGDTLFAVDAYRAFARAVAAAYKAGGTPNAAAIIAGMSDADAARAGAVLRVTEEVADAEKTALDCIRRIRRCETQARLEELKSGLSDPALSAAERTERLNEIQRLNREFRKG